MKTLIKKKTNEYRAKITGTLPNGKPIIINKDGTLSKVQNTDIRIGKGGEFSTSSGTGDTTYVDLCYDTHHERVVITYKRSGGNNYGYAVVGEVDPDLHTISFGTPVVFNSAQTEYTSPVFDSNNNRIVIAFKHDGDSQKGYAIVGDVNPTNNSISFGTAVKFNDGGVTPYIKSIFDTNANKVLICYSNSGNSWYGEARVATVDPSDNSISYGTKADFSNVEAQWISPIFDSTTNRVAVAFKNQSNFSIVVGNISGTTITWGSFSNASATNPIYIEGSFNTEHGFCVWFYGDQASNLARVAVHKIASGSNSFSGGLLETSIETFVPYWGDITYSPETKSHMLNYRQASAGTSTIFVEVKITSTRGASKSVQHTTTNDNGSNTLITHGSSCYDPVNKKTIVAGHGQSSNGRYVVLNGRTNQVSAKSTFVAGRADYIRSCYDISNKRIVIAYSNSDDGSDGYAVVGKVNADNTITFGTPVEFNPDPSLYIDICYADDQNKVVIVYKGNPSNNDAQAVVGTVNPTNNSITFATAVPVTTGVTVSSNINCVYDRQTKRVVVCWMQGSGTTGGYCAAGSFNTSGVLGFGGSAIFNTGDSLYQSLVYVDSVPSNSRRAVIFWRDDNNSNYMECCAIVTTPGSDTGTQNDLSFAANGVVNSGTTHHIATAFCKNTRKAIVAYMDAGNNDYLTVRGLSLSTTSPTVGPEQVILNNSPHGDAYGWSGSDKGGYRNKVTFDNRRNKALILTEVDGTKGIISDVDVGDLSDGSSHTVLRTHPVTEVTTEFQYNDIIYDPVMDKTVVLYADSDNNHYGTAKVVEFGKLNITADNYIGMSKGGTNTNGIATADIIESINDQQSNLTTGSVHYINTDGTLTTDVPGNTGNANDLNVQAGIALSTTELLVKG
tara:strand:+ start:1935 stop:4625 length:2691 start_codon:yes stop_codon:yes gene_type:complete